MRITDLKICGVKNPLGFGLTAPSVSWKVADTPSLRPVWQRVRVAEDKDFARVLYEKSGGELCSLAEPLPIALLPRTRYHVCVEVRGDREDEASECGWFETGKMDEPFAAHWIGTRSKDRFHPVFSRDFTLEEKPVSARLYACGLGLYEACLNGEKCGDEFLAPLLSDYTEEVQVQTYDVSDLLMAGDNRLSILCGNGWYKGRLGYYGGVETYGSRFEALAELRLRFVDGSERVIGTDESWSYCGSDFAFSDIYDGEYLDRQLWLGKKNPEKKALLSNGKKTVDRFSLPVVVKDTLPVKDVIRTPAGETVLDFGQNFTGTVEYMADLPAGTKIVLDHGEILQDGNFYNDNYRSAKVQMIYRSDGRREKVRAHFTYFGFRYVRVTGWPGEIKAEDFTGLVLYSDLDTALYFRCSDQKLNRLAQNAFWGQRSNFLDLPTDCPQRDERLGWTGDAQVFAPTACYQMDTRAFYRKFLRLLRGEQLKNSGAVPNYVPNFDNMPGGSSVWGDVASFLPLALYDYYGDLEALREQYPLMRDWLEWIFRQDEERGGKRLWNFGFHFGDWLAQDGVTEQSMKGGTEDGFVGCLYYYATACKLARAAATLERRDDAARYETLAEEIRAAILREYFTPNGRLAQDTQTAYLLCLNFGVYPDKERIVEGLKRRLQKDRWTIKGGFVGAPMMCRVLAENGMEDLAAYFLFQEGFPGWMHCVGLGATTIWERWNSVLDDGHISGTEMNSLNHYAYGSVMEYVYRDLAGIQGLEPGFGRVRFAPQPTWRLQELELRYDSASGTYGSYWHINGDGTLSLRFEVPFGCTAEAVLPGNGETVELTAGVFEKTYLPETDFRLKYGPNSRLGELLGDKDALRILREDLPLGAALIDSGDVEFLGLTMAELRFLFFRGLNPQMVDEGTKRLFAMKAFS